MHTPEQWHDKHHQRRNEPFESCWACARARAICKQKIDLLSLDEALEWVKDKNESDGYASPVVHYFCRWCGNRHMYTPTRGIARDRARRAMRKWMHLKELQRRQRLAEPPGEGTES